MMNTPSFLILRTFFRFALLSCLASPMIGSQLPTRQSQSAPDQQQTERVTTLKVTVRRVLLDVTVTDDKGEPVPNLKSEDFTVFEDKAPQVIRSFDVHKVTSASPVEVPKLPTNTFANISRAPSSGPTTVILYDLLNTPQDSQAFARDQLLAFLRQHKNGGQIAIFVLSDRLHMLQGFTDDDNKLVAALSKQAGKGYRSGLLQQSAGEATQSSDQLTATEESQNGADAQPGAGAQPSAGAQSDASFQQVVTLLKDMESTETSYLIDRRVDITVEALQEIARFLIGLPGRKNLLWLSGSFPSGILPDESSGGHDAFGATRNYSQAIVEATDLLTVSHVAVYPVDVRGLQPNAMFSASNNQSFAPGQSKISGALANFSQKLNAEHATMDTIADATGGHAFYNTNGLAGAVKAAVQDGSLYYSLSYAPTNPTYDGKIRKVRINLKQPGYHLAYRHTYLADNLDNVARNAMDNPDDLLAVALQHGAPAAHELFFEAHVQVEGAPVRATPGQMQELAKYEAMATKNKRKALQELIAPVMLQRYVIQYVLLPRQLDISTGEDAIRRDHLEFAVISYNEDGLTLNGLRTQLEDVIHPDRWSMMLSSGYHVPMAVLIPVQARSMRLAVHDLGNNHIGSLELSLPLQKEDAPAGNAVEKPANN